MEHAELLEKARPLFAEGCSINLAAKTLGITWNAAALLYHEIKSESASASTEESQPDPEVAADDDDWDVTIRVPASRANDIFATFTVAEKMDAISSVLQGRMNAALEPAESEAK